MCCFTTNGWLGKENLFDFKVLIHFGVLRVMYVLRHGLNVFYMNKYFLPSYFLSLLTYGGSIHFFSWPRNVSDIYHFKMYVNSIIMDVHNAHKAHDMEFSF